MVELRRALAGDRWRLYPAVMVWTILAALSVCGAVITLLASESRVHAAWDLLVLVVPGFWQSAQFGLPEPIAAALLLGGYLATRHDRVTAGAILFAMSLLVRETGAVLVAAVAAGLWSSDRRRQAIGVLAIAFVPLVAWRVGATLAPQWGPQAFFFNPQNLGMPFAGIAELWSSVRQGVYHPAAPDLARGALSLTALLGIGLLAAGAIAMQRPGAQAIAAGIYAAIAVSFTFDSIWIHAGNAQRGTYELFLVMGLLTLQRSILPRALRLGLLSFWTAATLYTFVLAHDADFIRGAIL